MKPSLHFFLLVASLLGGTYAASDSLSIHASGTTNPAKCYWAIMKELTSQSNLPLRMTYRAVGSTTGQIEFVNGNNVTASAAYFGSGDSPMTAANFAGLAGAGIDMFHLPVLQSAVSTYHSLPGVSHLNMTGTILAKIYSFEITDWKDQAIMDINPNMQLPADDDTMIRPVRRAKGSASTAMFTEFMHTVAPAEWPSDLVGSLPFWPEWNGSPGDNPVMVCYGSSGVANCIDSTKYAIGYLDAGQGNSAGLPEVRVQNARGTFLTTTESIRRGGLESAEIDILPTSPDSDFSEVSLINRPGIFTWPMISLTYIYVRKDLSFIDPVTRGALFGFFRALYNPSYIRVCADDYDHILPSEGIQDYGRSAVDLLEAANPGTVKWKFEATSTQALVGAGDHVFSAKRESSFRMVNEEELNKVVFQVEESLLSMAKQIQSLQAEVTSLTIDSHNKDTEIETLRSIVNETESEVQGLRAEVTSLTMALANTDMEIETMRVIVNETNLEVQDLRLTMELCFEDTQCLSGEDELDGNTTTTMNSTEEMEEVPAENGGGGGGGGGGGNEDLGNGNQASKEEANTETNGDNNDNDGNDNTGGNSSSSSSFTRRGTVILLFATFFNPCLHFLHFDH